MNRIESRWQDILRTGRATTAEALAWFDSLPPVDLEFMIGRWHGREITTGHPQDGVLTATRWYGKEFVDLETVHPLLHTTTNGKLFRVKPRPTLVYASLKMPFLKSKSLRPLSLLITRLLQTKESQARLRMVEYRGQVSATMIYDRLPINDHFRSIDPHTLLGAMDFKGVQQPYFFVLQRDQRTFDRKIS
jgi:hypothetical protein